MIDHSLANTARAIDSSLASEIERPSSTSALGLATRTLSSETSATAMARFSLDLRDLEAANARNPMAQYGTKAIMHELSTDSEVTFRRVLQSAEILPTRPGVDPLEVTRTMPDLSGTSQSPVTASPSVIARSQSGSVSPAASHVFGPQPNIWSTPDHCNARQTLKLYNGYVWYEKKLELCGYPTVKK